MPVYGERNDDGNVWVQEKRAERAEKVAADAATDGKAAGGQTKGRGKGKSGSGNKGTLSSTLEGDSKPIGSEKAAATLVD